jgi:hypothetical protein
MDIGLDFDGVIADGATLKSVVLKDRFGIDIAPELCKRKFALHEGWVSEKIYERMLRIVYEDGDMHALIKPVPGAIEAIHRLRMRGHTLRVVSARDPAAEVHVPPWLESHGIGMPVTCVGRFGLKTEACRGLDAYVDDDLVHLIPLRGVVARSFLFGPQPGFRKSWMPNGIKRVAEWKPLLEQLLPGRARVA